VTDSAHASGRGSWDPGQRLLTTGLVLLVTAGAFEGLAVPTVLPDTLDDLGGLGLYGWAFAGFWLASLVGIAVAGAEADRRGPLMPLVVGALAFAGGLLIGGLAPGMEWVVAGRVVQGLGAGAIAAITYVAIARGYAARAQPRMIAVISSAWVLPGLVGPAVAGWISQELDWRWAFMGLAPLVPLSAAAVALPLARLPAVTKARGEGAAGDRPRTTGAVRDALQLAAGTGAMLAAPGLGGWLPGLAVAALGVALLPGPVRRLLPPGTLTAATPRGAALAALGLLSVAFFGVEAFVPLAVASVRSQGTVAGGLALTAAAVTWALGSWVQARLAPRRSRASVTLAGVAFVGAGTLLVAAVPVTSLPATPLAAIAWALAGLGMGIAYSTASLVVIETAEPGREGAASASIQLAEALGIALGTGVTGALVALNARGALGLAPGIVVADVLMLMVLVLGVLAARRMGGAPPTAATPGAAALPSAERGPGLGP
jgi:MFS family permease